MKKILVCSLALLAAGLMAACKDSSKNDKDGEIYSPFSSGGTGGGIDTSGTSSTIRCTARTSMRRSQTAFPSAGRLFYARRRSRPVRSHHDGLSVAATMDYPVPPRWTIRCHHDELSGATTMDYLLPPRWTVCCRQNELSGAATMGQPAHPPAKLLGCGRRSRCWAGGCASSGVFPAARGAEKKKKNFLKKHHFVLDINGESC